MTTLFARFVGAALGAALGLTAKTALCDQFVAMDQTWVHTPDLADSHYRVMPSAETPTNWKSPLDYTQGTAWVYLEVHTKPTAQPTKFQVCFEATPTYACTNQSSTYTTVGTYQWSTPFSDFYVPANTEVDWTQGVNKLACILKDTMNNKPSADNVGAAEAALYTPTEVRMVVTIVSPGGTYVPPVPTGQGGAGGGGGSSSASTSAETSSAAISSAQASSTASGAGGAGVGGSSAININDPKSSGCSVSGNASPDAYWLGFVGIALMMARRRRGL